MDGEFAFDIIELIVIAIPLIICSLVIRRRQNRTKQIINKKITGENKTMIELIERLLGKTCNFTMIDFSASETYTIKMVSGNGVLCEDKKGNSVVLNIDYIISVTEVKPKQKKAK